MKYYRLRYKEESKEGDPSVYVEEDYDFDADDSISELSNYQTRRIPFKPNLSFCLLPKGKVTDLIEVSTIGCSNLLVNDRLLSILKEYNIFRYDIFPATLRAKDKIIPYHMLHFYDFFTLMSDEYDWVDFKKTIFFAEKTSYPLSLIGVKGKGVLGEFQVNSWKEYFAMREKLEDGNTDFDKIIFPKDKLYITKKEMLELDLFPMEFGNHKELHDMWISPRLAKRLKDEKISGVTIEPLPFEMELVGS